MINIARDIYSFIKRNNAIKISLHPLEEKSSTFRKNLVRYKNPLQDKYKYKYT